ncbi:MAG: L-fucose mutarotase [Verrucomicrobiales bacterium]|nr:L-fucose mutarotase [Verrucomicrobiales bacterium]
MLKGISPLISPQLLATLCEMGHGDRIVLADAHFPGSSTNPRVVRADGLKITDLLQGILPLFELDSYVDDAALMMAPVEGDTADPEIRSQYENLIARYSTESLPILEVERFAFYEMAAQAFAVVMTGDTAKYGNLIITKGVTPSNNLT